MDFINTCLFLTSALCSLSYTFFQMHRCTRMHIANYTSHTWFHQLPPLLLLPSPPPPTHLSSSCLSFLRLFAPLLFTYGWNGLVMLAINCNKNLIESRAGIFFVASFLSSFKIECNMLLSWGERKRHKMMKKFKLKETKIKCTHFWGRTLCACIESSHLTCHIIRSSIIRLHSHPFCSLTVDEVTFVSQTSQMKTHWTLTRDARGKEKEKEAWAAAAATLRVTSLTTRYFLWRAMWPKSTQG